MSKSHRPRVAGVSLAAVLLFCRLILQRAGHETAPKNSHFFPRASEGKPVSRYNRGYRGNFEFTLASFAQTHLLLQAGLPLDSPCTSPSFCPSTTQKEVLLQQAAKRLSVTWIVLHVTKAG